MTNAGMFTNAAHEVRVLIFFRTLETMMLSRRKFAQLCGVSAISLASGLEASDSTTVPKSRTIALDNDLFTTDMHRFFGASNEQDFPLDFYPGSANSFARVPVYMMSHSIEYDKKHESRLVFTNRMREILIRGMRQKIEIDMISVLIAGGIEKGLSTKSSIQFGSKYFEYIASPEAIESYMTGQYLDFSNVHENCFLGKVDSGRQDVFESQYRIKCNGDLAIRIKKPNRLDNRVIVTLPTLPPLMGFDTTFEFDTRTQKVTEKPCLKEGRNTVSLAYFCGLAVLDNRDIQLMDINTNG